MAFIIFHTYHYVELPCLRCMGLWKRQKKCTCQIQVRRRMLIVWTRTRSFTQEVHGAMHELHHAKHGQRFRMCRRRTNDPDQWTSTKCALGQGCWHTARSLHSVLQLLVKHGKTIEKCGILMAFYIKRVLAKDIVNTRLQHRFCSGTWRMAWKKSGPGVMPSPRSWNCRGVPCEPTAWVVSQPFLVP